MKPASTGDKYIKAPFTFGKIALDKDFTNRKKEIERLVLNFTSSVNTILPPLLRAATGSAIMAENGR